MKQIGLLIPYQYKLLSVAAIIDVLETVNKFYEKSGQPAPFNITLLHDSPVLKDSPDINFGYPKQLIRKNSSFDLLLIPAFTTEDMNNTIKENGAYIPWLQNQFGTGTQIASFCTGAFLLAATGLLDGKTATTHVDACKIFSFLFPAVNLRADKTVTQDGRLLTSGGATSTFHLLLHIVKTYCGNEIAVKTAKIFAIDMGRDNQSYFSTFRPSRNHNDELVASAQEKIETSYHNTGTIEEMIRDIPASRRNIVRRFKQVTGITPIEYLQHTRIEAAKKMLEQTGHQMIEVIQRSGYNDPKSFRKVFRKTVGMTPSEYRDKFHVN
jgi:transcriptional regulator GlxA family with amidase domain